MQMSEHLNHYDLQVVIKCKEVMDAEEKCQKVALISLRGKNLCYTQKELLVCPGRH